MDKSIQTEHMQSPLRLKAYFGSSPYLNDDENLMFISIKNISQNIVELPSKSQLYDIISESFIYTDKLEIKPDNAYRCKIVGKSHLILLQPDETYEICIRDADEKWGIQYINEDCLIDIGFTGWDRTNNCRMQFQERVPIIRSASPQ
jgi:hypothetical protein